jgi:hypothetical protein
MGLDAVDAATPASVVDEYLSAGGRILDGIEALTSLETLGLRHNKMKVGVDPLRQAQPGHQPMHGTDAAATHHVGVGAHLVVHRAAMEHRLRLRRPVTCLLVSPRHFAPTLGHVATALTRNPSSGRQPNRKRATKAIAEIRRRQ